MVAGEFVMRTRLPSPSRAGVSTGTQSPVGFSLVRVSRMHVPVECVPDPEVAGCGNAFVSVAVDDLVVRAAFDTGAPRTTLIDLPSSARLVGGGETTGAFGTEDVTDWEVGGIRLGSLRAGPLTVHRIEGGAGRHPVVGLDVLGTGSWQLDLRDGTLVTDAPSPEGTPFERAANGHLLTEMRWPAATATALFDTGAGITLIDRRFAAAHPHLFERAGSTEGTDVLGSHADLELARTCGYEIDGVRFDGHIVAVADLPRIPDHIDAAIGFPTITQARWTVDVAARRWCIER